MSTATTGEGASPRSGNGTEKGHGHPSWSGVDEAVGGAALIGGCGHGREGTMRRCAGVGRA